MIACDLVVGASNEALSKMRASVTRAVINSDVAPTSDFLRQRDWTLPEQALRGNILEAAGERDIDFLDASELAVTLLGDAIYTNPLLMGYAWQKGWLPLTRESILRAFELNAVSVKRNQDAFEWGRRYAADALAVRRHVAPAQVISINRKAGSGAGKGDDLDALTRHRAGELVKFQNAALAERYLARVAQVREAEEKCLASGAQSRPAGLAARWPLAEAVASNYYKLLACKDEYEVARLHLDPAFHASIAAQFEGDYRLRFHMSPPLFARIDERTGKPRKASYGRWIVPAFHMLKAFRFLRGTAFDPFGYSAERREERALVKQYEQCLDEVVKVLAPGNHAVALELARVPDQVRGYGHVKEPAMRDARLALTRLLGEMSEAREVRRRA